tara:strand:+ start:600 stop:1211 length:612 start_codon:yes stop_codon:yes gene_type:complete
MNAYEVKKETENNYNLGKIRQLIKTNKYLFKKQNNRYFDISNFEKNKLSVCPQGGGFVQSVDITEQKFINDFKNEKIIFKNELPFVWKKVKLYHDHWLSDNHVNGERDIEHFIEGYVTEHKWNGWSIPMVEIDQIKKFNEIQKKTLDSQSSSIFKIIDKDNISIRMFDEDEWITIERSEFVVNGKTIKAFDVSLGWTWSEEVL